MVSVSKLHGMQTLVRGIFLSPLTVIIVIRMVRSRSIEELSIHTTPHVMHVCNAKKSQKAVVGMGLSQDVHTYEDQYDFSQQGTREVDDEIASQENDDEIASQEIEDEIGSKLDHVMEAQRLEQDMRKIGGSSNGKKNGNLSMHTIHGIHCSWK